MGDYGNEEEADREQMDDYMTTPSQRDPSTVDNRGEMSDCGGGVNYVFNNRCSPSCLLALICVFLALIIIVCVIIAILARRYIQRRRKAAAAAQNAVRRPCVYVANPGTPKDLEANTGKATLVQLSVAVLQPPPYSSQPDLKGAASDLPPPAYTHEVAEPKETSDGSCVEHPPMYDSIAFKVAN